MAKGHAKFYVGEEVETKDGKYVVIMESTRYDRSYAYYIEHEDGKCEWYKESELREPR